MARVIRPTPEEMLILHQALLDCEDIDNIYTDTAVVIEKWIERETGMVTNWNGCAFHLWAPNTINREDIISPISLSCVFLFRKCADMYENNNVSVLQPHYFIIHSVPKKVKFG